MFVYSNTSGGDVNRSCKHYTDIEKWVFKLCANTIYTILQFITLIIFIRNSGITYAAFRRSRIALSISFSAEAESFLEI